MVYTIYLIFETTKRENITLVQSVKYKDLSTDDIKHYVTDKEKGLTFAISLTQPNEEQDFNLWSYYHVEVVTVSTTGRYTVNFRSGVSP